MAGLRVTSDDDDDSMRELVISGCFLSRLSSRRGSENEAINTRTPKSVCVCVCVDKLLLLKKKRERGKLLLPRETQQLCVFITCAGLFGIVSLTQKEEEEKEK